jgi:hypothetical protein
MFKTKEEMTIAEIHESLKLMGFGTSLENLAKMKPTELKKFYKKACKAFDLYYSVEKTLARLSAEEEGGAE